MQQTETPILTKKYKSEIDIITNSDLNSTEKIFVKNFLARPFY